MAPENNRPGPAGFSAGAGNNSFISSTKFIVKTSLREYEKYKSIKYSQYRVITRFGLQSEGICLSASAEWAALLLTNPNLPVEDRKIIMEGKSFVSRCVAAQSYAEHEYVRFLKSQHPSSVAAFYAAQVQEDVSIRTASLKTVNRQSFADIRSDALLARVARSISINPGTYILSIGNKAGDGHAVALQCHGRSSSVFDCNEAEFENVPSQHIPNLLYSLLGNDQPRNVNVLKVQRNQRSNTCA